MKKSYYVCSSCGMDFLQWAGRCSSCLAWDTISMQKITVDSKTTAGKKENFVAEASSSLSLPSILESQQERTKIGIFELDRVLGGGFVSGSIILLGGDPGIGKSTLVLQAFRSLSANNIDSLYVTGEESLKQVAMRSHRLGLTFPPNLRFLSETNLEKILHVAECEKPTCIAIDSIQTMCLENLPSQAGSISQLRETTSKLVTFGKNTDTTIFLIGHVTKDGSLAGPKVLEHMVDTVLYFEGEADSKLRLVRAVKNRFGAFNELGVFAMADNGLREVSNPSSIFLSGKRDNAIGSVITAVWEGTRPILVEVQALVDTSHIPNPKRVAVGLDQGRLNLLLAVLNKSAKIFTYDQDVFINAVGGVKITETAGDLPILLAVFSSLRNKPLSSRMLVFGEVGLGGEIRPVPSGQERIKEAVKHGFKKIIVPKLNAPKNLKQFGDEIEIFPVNSIADAIDCTL